MPSAVQLRAKKETSSTKASKATAKSAPAKSASAKSVPAKKSPARSAAVDKAAVVVAATNKTEKVMCVEQRHKMICEAAYYIALKNGFSSENAVEYWLMAEKEIDAKIF